MRTFTRARGTNTKYRVIKTVGWLLTSLVLAPMLAHGDTTTIRRFALMIGTNNGGDDRVRLRYANADAQRMAGVLRGFGGVTKADMVALHEATPDAIRAAFERLNRRIATARAAHRRVELVVYYSGHSDEAGLLPSGARMPWAELRDELKRTPADVRIAILDSCASGSLIRGKGGTRRTPFLVDQSSRVKGHAFLTSSSADEVAQESDRIGASYFTHHLVTGLRGAADVNNDRRVTLSEVYQYAFHQTLQGTEKTSKGPQHPNYDFELAGSGDVVITALHRLASTMQFAKHLDGRIFVRDDRGGLVAEIAKSPGRQIELGLPPGQYKVTLHSNAGLHSADITLRRGRPAPVKSGSFRTLTNRERTRGRGGRARRPRSEQSPTTVRAQSALNVQLVPGLSLSGVPLGSDITKLSLNLLGGVNHSIVGIEIGSLFNIATGTVNGGQYAGLFNFVSKQFDGVQAAGLFNSVGGDFGGVEYATIANAVTGSFRGLQIAVGANITKGEVNGGQVAMLNIAGDGIAGAQGGLLNIATGSVEGAQVGLLNIAGKTRGVQLSLANITTESAGAQFGVANVADKSTGLQIGLINVATEGDGNALGLLNFMGNGYNRLEAWSSDTSELNIGLKFGSRLMYTIVSAGMSEDDRGRYAQVSVGWGAHVGFGRYYLDVDGVTGMAMENDDDSPARVDLLSKLRFMVGRKLGDNLAVFGGVALNVAIGFDGKQPRQLQFGTLRTVMLDDQTRMVTGPGVFAGLSI